jgi:hypothetical protein
MRAQSALPYLRACKSLRVSSYDRTGGNRDWIDVEPGERRTLAEIDGPGLVRHLWMTMGLPQDDYLRRVILRMYWDGSDEPSVECPIGDFFGLGHANKLANDYASTAYYCLAKPVRGGPPLPPVEARLPRPDRA